MSIRKKKKGKSGALTIIGILIIFLSIVLVSYLNTDLKIDENAIKEEESKDKMEVSEGGGAVSLTYSNIVSVDKENKNIELYMKNPGKSRESIKIEIYAKEKGKEIKIGESKIIPPGYSIKEIELKEDIELKDYKGYMKIKFYNEKTEKEEIVDSKINVEIKVR